MGYGVTGRPKVGFAVCVRVSHTLLVGNVMCYGSSEMISE
jgi:hypothetical protein